MKERRGKDGGRLCWERKCEVLESCVRSHIHEYLTHVLRCWLMIFITDNF